MARSGGTTSDTGGRRTSRGRHREFNRGGVAVLGAALAISLTQLPVWADEETEPTDPHSGASAPVDSSSGQEAPADGADSGSGSDSAQPPATGGTGGSGGTRYGGRSTVPAPLVTLPDDANYPVPAPPSLESLPEGMALPEGMELPEEVDELEVFQRNVICDPVTKPGVIAVANLLGQHYDRPGYTLHRACIDLRSEHYDGRAVDWQLNAFDPVDRRIGDSAATWLTDNDGEVARRLGIQSIIWNNRAWHAHDGIWKVYVGQSAHTDHIHISLTWDGAAMRTSWWTGIALTAEEIDQGPCEVIGGAYAAVPQARRLEACVPAEFWPTRTDYSVVRPGGQGAGVGLVQPLLDVEQTGVLDAATREALIVWQGEQGVPQTGVLDQLTYAAALGRELPELPEGALAVETPDYLVTEFTPLKRVVLTEGDRGDDVAVLQRALEVEDDGIFGPRTAGALTEFAEEHPLLKDNLTSTDTLVWHLLEQRAYPFLAYRDIGLQIEDRGTPVVLLQRLLGVDDDGIFGPLTQQAVLDVQAAAELEETGIVDGGTWKAADEAAVAREAEEAEAEEDGQTDPEADAGADTDDAEVSG